MPAMNELLLQQEAIRLTNAALLKAAAPKRLVALALLVW
jgi:hypothetical protein